MLLFQDRKESNCLINWIFSEATMKDGQNYEEPTLASLETLQEVTEGSMIMVSGVSGDGSVR